MAQFIRKCAIICVGRYNNRKIHMYTPERLLCTNLMCNESAAESWNDHTMAEKIVQRASKFKNSNKHQILDKIRLLTRLGCSVEQIYECPFIVTLSEAVILNRFNRLKDICRGTVTVNLLLNVKRSGQLVELIDITKGYGTKESFIKATFQCTDEEWKVLCKKYEHSKWPHDLVTFQRKFDLLREKGMSIKDIRNCLSVFRFSRRVLDDRIGQILSVDQSLISVKNLAKVRFEEWLEEKRNELTMLSDVRYSFHGNNKRETSGHISLLTSLGYALHDITSHPSLFAHSTNTIVSALDACKGDSRTPVPLKQIADVLLRKPSQKPPKVNSIDRTLRLIAEQILLCDVELLLPYKKHLRPLRRLGISDVGRTVLYLESRGFQKSHIARCPCVLLHPTSLLARVIDHTTSCDAYTETILEPVKHLNLVQYHIEYDAEVTGDDQDHVTNDTSVVRWVQPSNDLYSLE